MVYSFTKAYGQIPHAELPRFRARAMAIFGIKSKVGFYARMRGEVEPKISEDQKLRELFAEYGITEIYDN